MRFLSSTNEDGLNTILKLSLEVLMKSEREIYKSNVGDYSNGSRNRKTHGRKVSKLDHEQVKFDWEEE